MISQFLVLAHWMDGGTEGAELKRNFGASGRRTHQAPGPLTSASPRIMATHSPSASSKTSSLSSLLLTSCCSLRAFRNALLSSLGARAVLAAAVAANAVHL